MKLTRKQMVTISFMLFSLFFGAGNLIFPPFLGQNAGSATVPAIIGFLLTAVFLAVARGEKYSFKRYVLLGCLVGIPLIYIPGLLQLKLLTELPWDKAFMIGVVPFIPLDIVKCAAAAMLAGPINKAFGRR